MSLTKLIVIGALAVALLPSDKQGQQKLLERAGDAAEWTWTFCDRNKQTCEATEKNWATFKEKAAFGAAVAQDAVWQALSNTTSDEKTAQSKRLGTLTIKDRDPEWRGRL